MESKSQIDRNGRGSTHAVDLLTNRDFATTSVSEDQIGAFEHGMPEKRRPSLAHYLSGRAAKAETDGMQAVRSISKK